MALKLLIEGNYLYPYNHYKHAHVYVHLKQYVLVMPYRYHKWSLLTSKTIILALLEKKNNSRWYFIYHIVKTTISVVPGCCVSEDPSVGTRAQGQDKDCLHFFISLLRHQQDGFCMGHEWCLISGERKRGWSWPLLLCHPGARSAWTRSQGVKCHSGIGDKRLPEEIICA